ncbi:MAG: putative sugar nucleotidyl transferase [Candidatus Bathyarchaeota archaeon]|jgi:UDP-N-acetylglucosamine diphosphorylase/glucosamine-1-phosphate N-acetyltransferase
MIISLFEDDTFENFFPLTYSKPVFELKSGIFSFLERLKKVFPDHSLLLFTRDYLVPTFKQHDIRFINNPDAINDDLILVNGTLVVERQIKQLIQKKLDRNVAMVQDGRVILAHLSRKVAEKHAETLCKPITQRQLKRIVKGCKILKTQNTLSMAYPWDLVSNCAELIRKDFKLIQEKGSEGTIDKQAVLYGDASNLHLGEGASIEAFAVLDLRSGPIHIGKETIVHAGSRITGPAYIGHKTIVASGLIREGCHIGKVCRVGGELDATILHSCTNKYHTGYVGHSYIGEWVNIGADTTNSDLKNTYGTVKVTIKEKKIDTRSLKVGCFIGDYAKTSIGTQVYTGKRIGVSSHAHGFVTEDVPSFTLWAKSLGAKPTELFLQSAIETQKRIFTRRGAMQTREDIELLKKIFKLTSEERRKARVVKRRFELQ